MGYKLKLQGEKIYTEKRVVSKILKLDESNQNGYAVTKPSPTGCIKKQEKVPTWQEFNMLLERVSLEDNIGHLFVVDIRFNREEATPKQLMYNELY